MSEPFLAEIRIVGFNFPPVGWAFCDGQMLPINQNQSLYSLLGTTYGGDGRTSFALPDLRGRTPVHRSDFHRLGQRGGAETITLTAAEIAAHKHAVEATGSEADSNQVAAENVLGDSSKDMYASPTAADAVVMRSGTIGHAGGGQAHNNMQPYTTLSYAIALKGLFPSRN